MPTPKMKHRPVGEQRKPVTEPDYRGPLYELVYWADAGLEPEENIELTAEQYAALKAHLATLKAPPVTSDQKYQARVNAAKERAAVINSLLGGGLSRHEFCLVQIRQAQDALPSPTSKLPRKQRR